VTLPRKRARLQRGLLSGLIVPSAEQSAEKLEELDSSRAKARSEEQK